MWLDDIYRCQSPRETAECLLASSPETMMLTKDVDLHRLLNLSDRFVDLVLNVEAVDGASMQAEEGPWEFHFGSKTAYEPAVAAGLFGFSSAVASAVQLKTLDAGDIHMATGAFDNLPRRYEENRSSATALAAGLRRYWFVPTIAAAKVLWIGVALCREAAPGDGGVESIDENLQRIWREFAGFGTDPISHANLLKGMVLMHVASVLDPAAKTRSTLDFSDLPGLAAQRRASRNKRGGQSGVAIAFQKRLADLMASFNCRIVTAGIGDPLGDIYLELPDGNFVLIDAKSTTASEGYSFPKAEQDAIARYLRDAPQVLPASRYLRSVLIVGPKAAPSLSHRIQQFEVEVGCDVRFCTASQLIRFRNAFPGGRLQGFDDVLHGGPHVLPDGWWQPIVERGRSENERLAAYLRDGRGS